VRKFNWISVLLFSVALASCSNVSSNKNQSPAPAATLSTLQVTPASVSLATHASQQFHATGLFSDGSTQDLTSSVTWFSSDSGVATINTGGMATAVATGVTNVTAKSGTTQASATLAVNNASVGLTSITLSPLVSTLAVHTTQQLTATGAYADGSSRDLTSNVTWSSSSAAAATVDVNGLVTGVAAGTTSITAALNGITQSMTLTITAPTITSISITPEGFTVPIGISQQFVASAVYSDGSSQDLVSGVTWTSSLLSAATIDANGSATTLAAGTTTITATVGSLTDSTTLTVVPAHLTSISVLPATATMAVGTLQPFTATGIFDDGSTQLLPSIQWSSSASNVLSITSTGLATAVSTGTSTVTAASGGISGSATVTVTSATLVSLAIAPLNSSMPIGATRQFTATGTFNDSTTEDMTLSVLWGSSNGSIASIDDKGLVSSSATGQVTISANWGSITQSTLLTVSTVKLISITVSPANGRVAPHTSALFTAVGNFSDGSTANLKTVSWKSSKPQFASIRSSGLAHGKKAGTVTISATSFGVTGTATLVIGTGTLVSVIVSPVNPVVSSGSTQQFAAIGSFSDGTTQDITYNSHWSSSAATIATIANNPSVAGLATTTSPGTTTIGVNSNGTTNSTSLLVQ
jgi:trimeric autotransporter adhesin